MSSRSRRLLVEASRFLAVGGLATLVALFLFNWLVHGFNMSRPLLEEQPILAYVIANTVGMVISYNGSRNYAFRDRPPRHADGGRTAYVIINVATMTLPIACLMFSRSVLGLDDPASDNISANVIGLAMGLGARFYLFRTFVFHRPIHLGELYNRELLESLDDPEALELPGGPVGGINGSSTNPSTNGRVPPPGP